jgi:signal transduction histidine kinase/DNA-binding NarL/FixJ family response regulator
MPNRFEQEPQGCKNAKHNVTNGNADQSQTRSALPQLSNDAAMVQQCITSQPQSEIHSKLRLSSLQKPIPSFLQWFCNLPLGRKQLIALIVAELVSIVGLSFGSRWIITTGLKTQLLNQAKAELTVTESYINLKTTQTALGFRSLANAPVIIDIAQNYAKNKTLPPPNQNQVKQILQNEIKNRNIEYATLIGRDFRIIVDANANRSGETFNPNNLVRQVFHNSKQIKANALVSWAELAKETSHLPIKPDFDAQYALIRYTLTPVRTPGQTKAIAVLISGDIVNNKLPIMTGILKNFRGGYSAIYSRQPTGKFAVATSLYQGESTELEQAKSNVVLNDTSLLAAAAAAPKGQIVTGRMAIGTQIYTMTAKAIPNFSVEEATRYQSVFSAQPVTILVRATPEVTLNNLLCQSLWQEEVVLVLALLVTGLWMLILRRTITKPIEQLGRAAQEFAAGIRGVRAKIFSFDEVGQLAITFNKMADSIVSSELNLLEQAHHKQTEAERTQLFTNITLRIRESLNLEAILKTAVEEVREVLKTHRVFIYRFDQYGNGVVAVESVTSPWKSILGLKTTDFYWGESSYKQLYKQGWLQATENIYTTSFSQSHIDLLAQFQVRANLVAPILQKEKLWGLLIANHCSEPRQWQQQEIDLLKQLATQIAIAIQQSELYQQVQNELIERKQAEAELQKAKVSAEAANQAKSKFLATMSHELRTPLNAILGFTQLINLDQSLSKEHQQHLDIISRSGQHLLKLINNVLEMSKIEAGQLTLNVSSFDLYHLLDTLREMLQLKASAKGLLLTIECSPDVPQYVITDESKLNQVLLNLLGNAMKFTKQGQINLRVSLVNSHWSLAKEPIISDERKMTIHFEVEDTGPGIAPDELERLFEPFEQTETGLKSVEGTGLGLPISQNFVQLMGGTIAVSSQPGVGSVFRFDIQVTLVHELAEKISQPTKRKVIGLAPRQPIYRILVADDNPIDRLLLVKLLTNLGFDVREAQDGQEVLVVWEHWEPHLIWMDMQMPVLNGYEVTKRIKVSLKSQPSVVIALTANAFEEDRQNSLLAGCDDFIRKPFDREELLAKLNQHLGVQYIYEDGKEEEKSKKENISYSPFNLQFYLKAMPVMWVEQLYTAALQCNDSIVFELLKQIPEDSSSLAVALTNFADNFQFDQIIILIQQVQTF